MILLFLDFDGVLHPYFPRRDIPQRANEYFSFLPRLEAVLRDYPEVNVVIASTWRKYHTLEELRAFFSQDLRTRVVGVTPVEPPGGSEAGERQREVETYLQEQKLIGVPWVALDDFWDNYLPDAPLVRCDDEFHDKEDAELRALLDQLRTRGDACM